MMTISACMISGMDCISAKTAHGIEISSMGIVDDGLDAREGCHA